MTENQAKTKWCPFAREVVCGSNERLGSYNRFQGVPSDFALCIGSKCMAWRWHNSNQLPNHPNYHDEGGYCGLAGKP